MQKKTALNIRLRDLAMRCPYSVCQSLLGPWPLHMRIALSFARIISIGFKPAEYGGRYNIWISAFRRAVQALAALWTDRLPIASTLPLAGKALGIFRHIL
jgi:hypothetical protein